MGGEQRPKRVFVVWDTETELVGDNLRFVADAILNGRLADLQLEATAVSPGRTTGQIWSDVVLRGLLGSDLVLALLDLPNANVGFEVGYALGANKRTVIACGAPVLPAWTQQPPLKGNELRPAEMYSQIVELMRSDLSVPAPKKPKSGKETLLLCPKDALGDAVRAYVEPLALGWKMPEPSGWRLAQLPAQLAGVGRVVWVVLPFHSQKDRRDGRENAAAAVTAGFALAHGIELVVWRHAKSRDVADVGHQAIEWASPADLGQLIETLPPLGTVTRPSDVDPLAVYRAHLRRVHSKLMPFLSDASGKALSDVYVEVETDWRADGSAKLEVEASRMSERAREPWTLQRLLELPTDPAGPSSGRWIVRGDPGAGKSTICRQLCWKLAGDASSPVPILVPLARWAQDPRDLFAVAASGVEKAHGLEVAAALAASLRELASTTDRVWILLDGLDEVPDAELASVRRAIADLAADESLVRCKLVVTTRPEGDALLEGGFERANLLPLGPERQRELLARWIPDRADEVWKRLESTPTLADLARNPLMLTLLARLAGEKERLPLRRSALYERAIRLLLKRGHDDGGLGMQHDRTAESILPPLSLALHETNAETWSFDELCGTLDRLTAEDEDLARWVGRWGSPEAFLRELGERSGLLAPQGDESEPWRYMHRSFREYLAAKQLKQLGAERYLALAGGLVDEDEDEEPLSEPHERGKKAGEEAPVYRMQHWGETIALLCGLLAESESRRELLHRLHARGPAILLRTLGQIEGLDPREAIELLEGLDGWDGDDLARLVETWRIDGREPGTIHELLWSRLAPWEGSTERLAYLWYALERLDGKVNRRAFFEACKRWPKEGFPVVETVLVPQEGGELGFEMGSPEGVGYPLEHPQHAVRFSQPFRLGTTAVTEAQYEAFDPDRKASDGEMPVVEVSWWEAWIFCRWVGGSLPTEAQWELACRAGTIGEWCVSKDDLKQVAWFDENSSRRVHRVAQKRSNAWGLFDMHGNVWEWCSDWFGEYAPGEVADPEGPPTGTDRVLRGGSAWFDADGCRSAYRNWGGSGCRVVNVGFRVALSAPRALEIR